MPQERSVEREVGVVQQLQVSALFVASVASGLGRVGIHTTLRLIPRRCATSTMLGAIKKGGEGTTCEDKADETNDRFIR